MPLPTILFAPLVVTTTVESDSCLYSVISVGYVGLALGYVTGGAGGGRREEKAGGVIGARALVDIEIKIEVDDREKKSRRV